MKINIYAPMTYKSLRLKLFDCDYIAEILFKGPNTAASR